MQAFAIKQFGAPNIFTKIDLPKPEVTFGHVLIRVMATSVNPVDYKIRSGELAALAPEFPAVLHGDVAGIIEAVGEGVTDFQPGDEVYTYVGGVKNVKGSLAEYLLADAKLVAHKPQFITWREAAALPTVAITAWSGLIDRAQVQPEQKVLIYGGTGGVGHIGIQLAKWAGATVYATVSSTEKAAIARQLGADYVINYRQQSVEDYVKKFTNGRGFDVVFDTVGNNNLQTAFQAAALNGTVVSILSLSQQDLTLLHEKGLSLHLVYILIPILHNTGREHHGNILRKLAQLIDQSKIRPYLDEKSFSFAEVAAAHQRAESGQAIGKVTLTQ